MATCIMGYSNNDVYTPQTQTRLLQQQICYTTSNNTDDATSWYSWQEPAETFHSATWVNWVNENVTSFTTANSTTWSWGSWWIPGSGSIVPLTPIVETEEQRQATAKAVHEAEEQWMAEARIQQEKALVAERRALDLLLDNLDANQTEIFEKTGAFPVTSQLGNHYSIEKGTTYNVKALKDGKAIGKLCFRPKGGLPVYDVMLAQKLALECAEAHAVKIANHAQA